jgi:hypothetical protein
LPRQRRYEELHRELDVNQLLQTARQKAGLMDFGDDRFYEPLRKLLDCAASETDFHAQGLQMFKTDVTRWLVNRLRMHHDVNQHPEILEEDVSDPIVVMGLGRSGTTKLHKLLSTPDNVQKTLFWRLWNPAPFPDALPGKPDPRIAAAGSASLLSEDNPIMDAAHHVEQQEVEEAWTLHYMTFDDWSWGLTTPMSSWFDWVMSRSSLEPFRYVKAILQYLQWQDGGKRGRPWILKSAGYIANLDSLLACHPNATLVHSHRDPRDTIPSWSKFNTGLYSITANPLDPHFIGAEVQRTWSIAMDRYLEARARLALNERILDVKYEQIRTDPLPIMTEVYRRAGRRLDSQAERKMAHWHDTNEQGRYGKHQYSLEEFGLSEQGIETSFRDYIRRFINS